MVNQFKMRLAAIKAVVLVALCVGGMPTAIAASFDCTKADTPIDKAICTTPVLSALDDQLSVAYRDAKMKAVNPDQFVIDGRNWLVQVRNRCQDTDCLSSAYQSRINELKGNANLPVQQSEVNSQTNGQAAENGQIIKTRYGPLQLAFSAAKVTILLNNQPISSSDRNSVDGFNDNVFSIGEKDVAVNFSLAGGGCGTYRFITVYGARSTEATVSPSFGSCGDLQFVMQGNTIVTESMDYQGQNRKKVVYQDGGVNEIASAPEPQPVQSQQTSKPIPPDAGTTPASSNGGISASPIIPAAVVGLLLIIGALAYFLIKRRGKQKLNGLAVPAMDSATYEIVIDGIGVGASIADVRTKMAVLFKAAPEQMDKILASPGFVAKTGLTREMAEKYKRAIEATGCNCRIAAVPPEAKLVPTLPLQQPPSKEGKPADSFLYTIGASIGRALRGTRIVKLTASAETKTKAAFDWNGIFWLFGLALLGYFAYLMWHTSVSSGLLVTNSFSNNLLEKALVLGKSTKADAILFSDAGGLDKKGQDLWRDYKVSSVNTIYNEQHTLGTISLILYKDWPGAKLASIDNLHSSMRPECGDDWKRAGDAERTSSITYQPNGKLRCGILVRDDKVDVTITQVEGTAPLAPISPKVGIPIQESNAKTNNLEISAENCSNTREIINVFCKEGGWDGPALITSEVFGSAAAAKRGSAFAHLYQNGQFSTVKQLFDINDGTCKSIINVRGQYNGSDYSAVLYCDKTTILKSWLDDERKANQRNGKQ